MSYYERQDIPFHFALAENFTICDGYHCSLLGPTWPNRMFLMTGWNDPNGTAGGPIITNVVPTPPYNWGTYPERLEAAGISWQVYQEEDDYGTNVLEYFQNFQNAEPGSGLYERGLTISQPGKFEADCAAGNLPTVTWIVPTSGKSEHPAYLPATGADWLASKIEAVAANPDLWEQTLFILNYDENDGLFDHVPPPLPPAGTPDEFVSTVPVGGTTAVPMPIGGGVRVPCILISPWTVGGYVATENFDHTSVLQLLELITGVEEPNISQWRRDTFGDLTSALGMGGGKAQKAPNLAGPQELSELFWEAEYQVENLPAATPPGAIQPFPQQEKHRRPDWMPDVKKNGKRHHGRRALPKTTSRLLENQTNHAGDFEQLKYKDSQFPGILESEDRQGDQRDRDARVGADGRRRRDRDHRHVDVRVRVGAGLGDQPVRDRLDARRVEDLRDRVRHEPGVVVRGRVAGRRDRRSRRARRSSSGSTRTASRSRPTALAPTSPTPVRTPGPGGSDTVSAIKVSTDTVVEHVHGRSGAADHRGLARQLQAVRDLRAGAVHGRCLQRPQEAGRDGVRAGARGGVLRPTATGCSSPTRSTIRCWCSTARASRSPVRSRSARPRGTSRSRRTRSRPT